MHVELYTAYSHWLVIFFGADIRELLNAGGGCGRGGGAGGPAGAAAAGVGVVRSTKGLVVDTTWLSSFFSWKSLTLISTSTVVEFFKSYKKKFNSANGSIFSTYDFVLIAAFYDTLLLRALLCLKRSKHFKSKDFLT